MLSESKQHEDGDYVSSILEIFTVSYCCEGFFNLAHQMLFALFLLIVLLCTIEILLLIRCRFTTYSATTRTEATQTENETNFEMSQPQVEI